MPTKKKEIYKSLMLSQEKHKQAQEMVQDIKN